MKISVILPTNRPSGPMYGLHGLSKQTFPQEDFELIIVDDYPEDRSTLIVDTSKLLGLENVLALKSKPHYWRSNRLISNARNTALIHAKGELVVFLDDYCWIRPRWLDKHWETYKKSPYTMVGAMRAVEYTPNVYDGLDRLPTPEISAEDSEQTINGMDWVTEKQKERRRELSVYGATDTRGVQDVRNCGGGWFYSCNAAAPLRKLVEVNGFDEEYDLTSEEDIDLGLRLTRVKCKFWYRPDPDCTVFHMDHREIDRKMRTEPKRYGKVTYQDLRDRGTKESEPGEVQLVLKEKYGTKYDGSWGLHEHRYFEKNAIANIIDGKRIFDLRVERRKQRNA